MRTPIRRAWLSLSLSLSLLVLCTTKEVLADGGVARKAAPGGALKSDEASERFRSGVAFYKDRDFTAALVEFKRAYELAPNYRVLFNLGQTARELRDYASALSTFERYLREGGQEIGAARRKDVQAFIDELTRKVGKITVSTGVEGAEILVDDVPVGVAPLSAPIVVNVGRRKLTATRPGYTPSPRFVDVAGMMEATVTLDLTRIEEPRAEAPPIEPVKPGPPVVVLVMLSTTAASAVVTGVMGGLALSARGGLNKALATFPGNATSIADAQGRTRTFALGADIALGLTIAGAVTTSILVIVVAPRGSDKAAPAAPRASFGVSPSGLVVRGVF